MRRELYSEILNKIHSNMCVNSSREYLVEMAMEYKSVPVETLGSIYSQDVQRRMKKQHYKHATPDKHEQYYKSYKSAAQTQSSQILLKLAKKIDLCPALLARIILEQYLVESGLECEEPAKTVVTQLMKEPTLIEDAKLAEEIHMCIVVDENYGPLVDTVKHSVGHEYEYKLVQQLKDHGLPFLDEDKMRLKGYDKTPDIKLEIPIAVDGHMVNWIESKASFGDDESHKSYLKDQFWSYWNRFGPGMVIYWFGFIDDLDINQEKGIILRDCFPDDFVKMDPLIV